MDVFRNNVSLESDLFCRLPFLICEACDVNCFSFQDIFVQIG